MGHWSFKTFLGLWTKISEEARIGVVKVGYEQKLFPDWIHEYKVNDVYV